MLSLLPDFADPLRLCSLGKVYEGTVPLADLPRLAPLLTSTQGEAAFTLAFDMDAERRPVVRVKVSARLALQCQRCLGEMTLDVDSDSLLAVVSGTDEAERLPDALDPLLVEDAKMELRSLIEDELILTIPSAPLHPAQDCKVKVEDVNARSATAPAPREGEEHPFAALAAWKSDTQKRD
ncbi:MAG: DUF177 domain-containing protein [Gammaproteobacteria bacterium]|nr:DUF177 domain-containing protein [Gammaproteobacteria bacterium]